MDTQPNIVLVITDDQGYPALGSSGHPFIQTPNLDAFHGDSVRFTDFHSGTTCAPTRAGLFTGRSCNSTGVWHTIGGRSLLRRGEVSIASRLAAAGYATGLFGKWHLGDEYPYRPQDRGFATAVCHGGGGISQQPDWWGNDYFDDTYMVDGEPTSFEGYCTDVFFDRGMRFIEDNASDKHPFLCVISTNAPHSPFNIDPRYRDLYVEHTNSDAYARFLGMCTNIDENFGRLRAHLSALGIESDTILIFMSDNGQTQVGDPEAEVFNAGMRGFKGSEYEGGHRIPFFIRWENSEIAGGRDVPQLSAYIDVTPTLLELAGIPAESEKSNEEHSMDGVSLAPLLRGRVDGFDWDSRIVVTDTQRVAHPLKWRKSCAMKGRWRLVNHDELYDLAADPSQTTDVSASHPDLVNELRDGYEQWWSLCTDGVDSAVPFPVGGPDRPEAVLRTHDLRNDFDNATVWNQGQVRSGDFAAGWWEIDAMSDGEYEIELRRWPREAGHAIAAGIDGDDVDWNREGVQPGASRQYSGGVAIPYTQATVIVDEHTRAETRIDRNSPSAVLHVPLARGEHHLRAIFSNERGDYCAAYYVYVRATGTPAAK